MKQKLRHEESQPISDPRLLELHGVVQSTLSSIMDIPTVTDCQAQASHLRLASLLEVSLSGHNSIREEQFPRRVAICSALTPVCREVVLLSVGAAWPEAYNRSSRRIAALSVGMSTEDVDCLERGDTPACMHANDRMAQRLVLALFQQERSSSQVYQEAVTCLGANGVIAVLHLVSLYTTTSCLVNGFDPATLSGDMGSVCTTHHV